MNESPNLSELYPTQKDITDGIDNIFLIPTRIFLARIYLVLGIPLLFLIRLGNLWLLENLIDQILTEILTYTLDLLLVSLFTLDIIGYVTFGIYLRYNNIEATAAYYLIAWDVVTFLQRILLGVYLIIFEVSFDINIPEWQNQNPLPINFILLFLPSLLLFYAGRGLQSNYYHNSENFHNFTMACSVSNMVIIIPIYFPSFFGLFVILILLAILGKVLAFLYESVFWQSQYS
ncbi:MAG: hypothetical protein HeimC2_26660 [Candidatus Heimdallarchaeota archaeon LC_2]|nr:MAG: hypothetical protein HeimC2_26660 [Candidatus Heimdallarchaeota archaeon LC_2]